MIRKSNLWNALYALSLSLVMASCVGKVEIKEGGGGDDTDPPAPPAPAVDPEVAGLGVISLGELGVTLVGLDGRNEVDQDACEDKIPDLQDFILGLKCFKLKDADESKDIEIYCLGAEGAVGAELKAMTGKIEVSKAAELTAGVDAEIGEGTTLKKGSFIKGKAAEAAITITEMDIKLSVAKEDQTKVDCAYKLEKTEPDTNTTDEGVSGDLTATDRLNLLNGSYTIEQIDFSEASSHPKAQKEVCQKVAKKYNDLISHDLQVSFEKNINGYLIVRDQRGNELNLGWNYDKSELRIYLHEIFIKELSVEGTQFLLQAPSLTIRSDEGDFFGDVDYTANIYIELISADRKLRCFLSDVFNPF